MADGPEAVSPISATGWSPGTNGLGSGSAAAIESKLRGRLQGAGHSGAPGIAHLAARFPTAQGTAVVCLSCRTPRRDTLSGLLRQLSYRRSGYQRKRRWLGCSRRPLA